MRNLKTEHLIKQTGFSLVESVIALTIGSLLVSTSIGVYVSSRASYQFQASTIKDRQTGVLASETFNRQLRMAGYRNQTISTYGSVFPKENGSIQGGNTDSKLDRYHFEAGEVISGNSKSLTIRYQGDGGATGVTLTDCTGARVPKNQVVVINFKIKGQALQCIRLSPSRSEVQTVLSGYSNLSFQYGVDTNNDGNADIYRQSTDSSFHTVSLKYSYGTPGQASGDAQDTAEGVYTQVVQLRNNNP